MNTILGGSSCSDSFEREFVSCGLGGECGQFHQ